MMAGLVKRGRALAERKVAARVDRLLEMEPPAGLEVERAQGGVAFFEVFPTGPRPSPGNGSLARRIASGELQGLWR